MEGEGRVRVRRESGGWDGRVGGAAREAGTGPRAARA